MLSFSQGEIKPSEDTLNAVPIKLKRDSGIYLAVSSGKSIFVISPKNLQIIDEYTMESRIISLIPFGTDFLAFFALLENFKFFIFRFPLSVTGRYISNSPASHAKHNSFSGRLCSASIFADRAIRKFDSRIISASCPKYIAINALHDVLSIFSVKGDYFSVQITVPNIVDMCFLGPHDSNNVRIAILGDINVPEADCRRYVIIHKLDIKNKCLIFESKVEVPNFSHKLLPIDPNSTSTLVAFSYNGVTRIKAPFEGDPISEFFTCNVDYATLFSNYYKSDLFLLFGASGLFQVFRMSPNEDPYVENILKADDISSMTVIDGNKLITTSYHGEIVEYEIKQDSNGIDLKEVCNKVLIGEIDEFQVNNDSSFRVFTGHRKNTTVCNVFKSSSITALQSIDIGPCIDIFAAKYKGDVIICLSYFNQSRVVKLCGNLIKEIPDFLEMFLDETTLLFREIDNNRFIHITDKHVSILTESGKTTQSEEEVLFGSASDNFVVLQTKTELKVFETKSLESIAEWNIEDDSKTLLMDSNDKYIVRYCVNQCFVLYSIVNKEEIKRFRIEIGNNIPTTILLTNNDSLMLGTIFGTCLEVSIDSQIIKNEIFVENKQKFAVKLKSTKIGIFAIGSNIFEIKDGKKVHQMNYEVDNLDAVDDFFLTTFGSRLTIHRRDKAEKISSKVEYHLKNAFKVKFYKEMAFVEEINRKNERRITVYNEGILSNEKNEEFRITLFELLLIFQHPFLFVAYENKLIRLLKSDLTVAASATASGFVSAVCKSENTIFVAEGKTICSYNMHLERLQSFELRGAIFTTSMCYTDRFLVVGDAMKGLQLLSLENDKICDLVAFEHKERGVSSILHIENLIFTASYDSSVSIFLIPEKLDSSSLKEEISFETESQVTSWSFNDKEVFYATKSGGIFSITFKTL